MVNRFYSGGRIKFYCLFPLSFIASVFEYVGLFLIIQFSLLINSNNIKSGLMLGLLIAFIYIFKNVYMLIFTFFSNFISADFSTCIQNKLFKDILYGDYVLVNSIPKDKKQAITAKVDIVVWGYILQYIELFSNIAIIIALLAFLFIKFTLIASFATIFLGILSYLEYIYLKHKSNLQNEKFNKAFDKLNYWIRAIIDYTKEIRLNSKTNYYLQSAKNEYKRIASLNKDRMINSTLHIYFTEISVMIA